MPGTGSPHTPLAAILRSFTAPISEEHGWATIHQSCLALATAPAPLHLVENTLQQLQVANSHSSSHHLLLHDI